MIHPFACIIWFIRLVYIKHTCTTPFSPGVRHTYDKPFSNCYTYKHHTYIQMSNAHHPPLPQRHTDVLTCTKTHWEGLTPSHHNPNTHRFSYTHHTHTPPRTLATNTYMCSNTLTFLQTFTPQLYSETSLLITTHPTQAHTYQVYTQIYISFPLPPPISTPHTCSSTNILVPSTLLPLEMNMLSHITIPGL